MDLQQIILGHLGHSLISTIIIFFWNVCVGCTENQDLPKKKKNGSKAAYRLPLPDLPKWEFCALGISTSMLVIVNKCLCDGMVWKIGCFAWWEYQNLRKELLLI